MNKAYPERINWEDEPSIATSLGARNLNKIDYATYEMDNRIIALDANKANQSDLLLDIKSVAYNPTTGVWIFTHQNGTTDTFDQNIEKIPVTFSMDENGVITMTTADGTTYTCDVGTLIKTITFVNSGNIQFTVTTDAQGNKSVTANIIDGSITRAKLDPDYLAQIDVDVAAADASARSAGISANTASSKALDSEAYAIGTRGGVPVTSDDPAYNNNSKYYAEHGASSLGGLTDVNISGVTNGQVIKYNSATHKWENDDESGGGGGILPHLIVISETGSTVTATKGQTVITATETSTGHFECDLAEFGTWTIDAVLGGEDAQVSLVVDTVKVYTVDDSHFHATVTVKYPSGATCKLQSTDETLYATGSPYTFTVHHKETYTITVTYNQRIYTDTVTFTTEGQSFSKTLPTPSEVDANDINWWLFFGDVSDTFSTLSDILADSTALATLMANTDAVDYLVRCKDWSSNDGLVPVMTSDTTPSGVCSTNSKATSDRYAYLAFATRSNSWLPAVGVNSSYLQYDFGNENDKVVQKVSLRLTTSYSFTIPIEVSGSDDGTTFTSLTTDTISVNNEEKDVEIIFKNTTSYRYYRITFNTQLYVYGTGNACNVRLVQFYALDETVTENQNAMSYIGLNNYCANTLLADEYWCEGIANSEYVDSVLNVKIPTMTSASTPSGTVSCSTAYSGTNGWYAFDKNLSTQYISNSTGDDLYVQYMFPSKIHAYIAYVAVTSNGSTTTDMTYKIQGSNNGSSWTDIIDNQTVSVINTSNTIKKHTMNKEYKYFRLLKVSSTSTIRFCVPEFNIYGRKDV